MGSEVIEKGGFLTEIHENEVKILCVRGGGGSIVVPREIEGLPVTEIGAYAFSAHGPYREEGAVCGEAVTEVFLPETVERIGRYAFYGCGSLRRLEFSSGIRDIGAGAFTGCHRVQELKVTVADGKRSCLPGLLLELREMQKVEYHSSQGEARLVFPEFFEEAVENTPARILETHTHGSGILYRNCFVQTELQFDAYDRRFPWAKENEKTETALELAFGRLLYPLGLGEEAREEYERFLKEHLKEAAAYLMDCEEAMERTRYVMEHIVTERKEADFLLDAAGTKNMAEITSFLMECRHRRFPEREAAADPFEL